MDTEVTRREFMWRCALCGLGAALSPALATSAYAQRRRWRPREGTAPETHPAMHWEALSGGRVRCLICPNRCERGEGGTTACRTRVNRGGKMYTLTYGKPCVVFEDPLEKNPLYHVAPGQSALGVGTAGCNLRCSYCQNWNFAQVGPWETRNMDLSPEELIERVHSRGLKWITFSYTEPVAYYEYAIETARLAQKQGIKVAVCTGGYINEGPLEELIECCDAFSVTLKGYTDEFYREVVGCPLGSVWKSIVKLARSKRWMEIVTLIVPTLNDEEKGLRALARSVAGLDKEIPLHFLRFAPAWKLKNLPPTPITTLEKARNIALEEGLDYVYLANLPAHAGSNTYCPSCGRKLIERVGFKVIKNEARKGYCPKCRHKIPGLDLSA